MTEEPAALRHYGGFAFQCLIGRDGGLDRTLRAIAESSEGRKSLAKEDKGNGRLTTNIKMSESRRSYAGSIATRCRVCWKSAP